MEPERLREQIASAQTGQAGGLEALLEAYGSRLYGYFLRTTGNHHDAEDLLGEMSLRLVRSLKSYDERGRFEPWLFRLAANLLRDRIRRVKASPTPTSLSLEDDSGASLADKVPGQAEAVDDGLMAAEVGERLAAAMDKLDPATRQVIVLRHFGELSFKEIAELCQCPIGTVLARVHRGLKALRRWMGDDDGTR